MFKCSISQVEHDEASFTTYLTAEPKDLVDAFDRYDIDFGFMDYTQSKVNRKRHMEKREPRDPNLSAFAGMGLQGSYLDTETQDNIGVETDDADNEDKDVPELDDSKKKNSGKINTNILYDVGNDRDDVGNDQDDVEEAPPRSRSDTRQIIVDIAAGDDRAEEQLLNVNDLGYVKV